MVSISKITLILFVYTITILHANIDEEIQAIRHAPITERYKLMNDFKKNLIKMNEKERMEALKKLTKNKNQKNVKKALQELQRKNKDKSKHMRKEIERQQINIDNVVNETEDFNGGDNDHE